MNEIISKLFTLFVYLRRSVYIILGLLDSILLPRPNLPVILSYHSVSNDAWRFSINLNTVKKQIEFLSKHYDFMSLQELELYIKGKVSLEKPAVVLTFDDGYKDILHLRKYFEQKNIKPVLFVMSDTKHFNRKELGTKREFLNKSDLKSLSKSGWEIGSHSATHPDLSKLSAKELKNEVQDSKRELEKLLGTRIKYFAYPRGKYSPAVLSSVKKVKYILGLTMDDGFITTGSKPFTLPRIGVDRTHSFAEFKYIFSPSVIIIRKIIKNTIIGRYL